MGIEKLFQPGKSAYFVGIKGTGVCAMAELMHEAGIKVRGSDTGEVFYTDAILKDRGISYYENFDRSHITDDIDFIVHSAAYCAQTNVELSQAVKRNIPVIKYTDALGAWSAGFDSTGIAGVHGKTTVTAISGVLIKAANIPAQILAGSAVADFNGRSTLSLGKKYFVAETCEYRKHFLSFNPKHIILTSVESDHQDFFPDYESIRDAFVEYCRLLPEDSGRADGALIYCADDPGASEAAGIIKKEKPGIAVIPYGFSALGDYKITSWRADNERAVFGIAGFPGEFKMKIPGKHQAQNAAAALALVLLLLKKEGVTPNAEKIEALKKALENFKGSKRRSEIIGEAAGIIFMDDYGHHPTAIKTTLAGIKSFYPSRRLVVSFMSHTYTRTATLLNEFAGAFTDADFIFLHKIYASAREKYSGGINGKTLYEKIAQKTENARYTEEPLDAFEPLTKILKPGDIFITLGAGNNWPLCEKLFCHYKATTGFLT